MPNTFRGGGLTFLYPDNWGVEESRTDQGWSVTVQSDGTAFAMVNGYADRPEVHEVLATVVEALREDYPDLEMEATDERLAGQRATGHDIQFFSFDFVTTCRLRSFRTSSQTILVLCQSSDIDEARHEPVLRAIRASLCLCDEP